VYGIRAVIRCPTRRKEDEGRLHEAHRPGEAMQTDFTSGNELGVTIVGEPFDHLLCHPVLPYSNWESVTVCRSESMAALRRGVQAALFELGRVSEYHQTDNSTAATHAARAEDGSFVGWEEGSREGRLFNDNYNGDLAVYVNPDTDAVYVDSIVRLLADQPAIEVVEALETIALNAPKDNHEAKLAFARSAIALKDSQVDQVSPRAKNIRTMVQMDANFFEPITAGPDGLNSSEVRAQTVQATAIATRAFDLGGRDDFDLQIRAIQAVL